MKTITLLFFVLTIVLAAKSYSHGRYNNKLIKNNCFFHMCQEVPDYPEAKINKIIQNNTFLHSYFGQVFQNSDPPHGYRRRRSNGNENGSSCKSLRVQIAPKIMQDTENISRIIVNVDQYRQTVEFEKCENDVEACCVQELKTIKLVTVNMDTEVIEFGKFQVPSYCACPV